jgi:hypothetical protein
VGVSYFENGRYFGYEGVHVLEVWVKVLFDERETGDAFLDADHVSEDPGLVLEVVDGGETVDAEEPPVHEGEEEVLVAPPCVNQVLPDQEEVGDKLTQLTLVDDVTPVLNVTRYRTRLVRQHRQLAKLTLLRLQRQPIHLLPRKVLGPANITTFLLRCHGNQLHCCHGRELKCLHGNLLQGN